MKTNRNLIEAKIRNGDNDMSDEIDAVYEICDAEFPSEAHLYKSGMDAIARYSSSTKVVAELTKLFVPEVRRIAARDGLMSGLPDVNFKAVAERIAKDWDNSFGKDHRREQAQTPAI